MLSSDDGVKFSWFVFRTFEHHQLLCEIRHETGSIPFPRSIVEMLQSSLRNNAVEIKPLTIRRFPTLVDLNAFQLDAVDLVRWRGQYLPG